MPRKNSNGTKPRHRSKYAPAPVKRSRDTKLKPIPLDQIVVPVGRCYLNHRKGKLKFTAEQVDRALSQAQHGRALKGQSYAEERYYLCDRVPGGCGMYHLTSQTERPA